MALRWGDYDDGDDNYDLSVPWLDDGAEDGELLETDIDLRSYAQVVAGSSLAAGLPTGLEVSAGLLSVEDGTSVSAACAGDPVGIRAVQSILMSATQTNLSHFHTAGMNISGAVRHSRPSAAEAMDSLYNKHNTSMKFDTSVSVKDIRRCIVGANLGLFVTTVGSSFTVLPARENVWYDALDSPFYDSVIRFYIDYRKMRDHGLTLKTLADKAFGDDCLWKVSPDFMGMIDVEVKGVHMSSWLSRMECRVCGTPEIISCDITSSTAVTRGTNVLVASRTPGVDRRTIVSNNVTEVEKRYGVEAAAGVLAGLVGSRIVSDFMARTGKIMPFNKRSKEVHMKGLLTSMGFERPKEDIKKAVATAAAPNDNLQVHECIMTGIDPPAGFDIITQ
jgi:hypothetical protein